MLMILSFLVSVCSFFVENILVIIAYWIPLTTFTYVIIDSRDYYLNDSIGKFRKPHQNESYIEYQPPEKKNED